LSATILTKDIIPSLEEFVFIILIELKPVIVIEVSRMVILDIEESTIKVNSYPIELFITVPEFSVSAFTEKESINNKKM